MLIQRIARTVTNRIETEHFRLCTTTTLATISSYRATAMRIGQLTLSGLMNTRTIRQQGMAASESSLLEQRFRRRHPMAKTSL